MSEQIYDVNYFLSFFSKIPEDQWCVGKLGGEGGQCCAYGHLNVSRHGHWGWAYNDENYASLARALDRVLRVYKSGGAAINNGYNPRYQQPTPKLRILQALHDIKQLQQEQEAEKNLRQVGVESRHAPRRSKVCGGALILAQGAVSEAEHQKTCKQAGRLETDDHLASGPSYDHPERSQSPSSDGHLPQSLSPVTSALAKQMPCAHLLIGGACVYCGHVEVASAPVKSEVGV